MIAPLDLIDTELRRLLLAVLEAFIDARQGPKTFLKVEQNRRCFILSHFLMILILLEACLLHLTPDMWKPCPNELHILLDLKSEQSRISISGHSAVTAIDQPMSLCEEVMISEIPSFYIPVDREYVRLIFVFSVIL